MHLERPRRAVFSLKIFLHPPPSPFNKNRPNFLAASQVTSAFVPSFADFSGIILQWKYKSVFDRFLPPTHHPLPPQGEKGDFEFACTFKNFLNWRRSRRRRRRRQMAVRRWNVWQRWKYVRKKRTRGKIKRGKYDTKFPRATLRSFFPFQEGWGGGEEEGGIEFESLSSTLDSPAASDAADRVLFILLISLRLVSLLCVYTKFKFRPCFRCRKKYENFSRLGGLNSANSMCRRLRMKINIVEKKMAEWNFFAGRLVGYRGN